MEKESGVLELPQRQHTELECVVVTKRNFPPAIVAKVRIFSRHDIQRLEWVIGEAEVVEVLCDELTGAGDVRVV